MLKSEVTSPPQLIPARSARSPFPSSALVPPMSIRFSFPCCRRQCRVYPLDQTPPLPPPFQARAHSDLRTLAPAANPLAPPSIVLTLSLVPAATPAANSRCRPMSAAASGVQTTAGPETIAAAIRESEVRPGTYALELERAASRLCLLQLLDAVEGAPALALRRNRPRYACPGPPHLSCFAEGRGTLRGVTLGGKKVPRASGWEVWPHDPPGSGLLEVELREVAAGDGGALKGKRRGALEPLPMRTRFVENLCAMLNADGPLDEWRVQMVRMVCLAGLHATAEQAAQIVMAFGQGMGGVERGQVRGGPPPTSHIAPARCLFASAGRRRKGEYSRRR